MLISWLISYYAFIKSYIMQLQYCKFNNKSCFQWLHRSMRSKYILIYSRSCNLNVTHETSGDSFMHSERVYTMNYIISDDWSNRDGQHTGVTGIRKINNGERVNFSRPTLRENVTDQLIKLSPELQWHIVSISILGLQLFKSQQ